MKSWMKQLVLTCLVCGSLNSYGDGGPCFLMGHAIAAIFDTFGIIEITRSQRAPEKEVACDSTLSLCCTPRLRMDLNTTYINPEDCVINNQASVSCPENKALYCDAPGGIVVATEREKESDANFDLKVGIGLLSAGVIVHAVLCGTWACMSRGK